MVPETTFTSNAGFAPTCAGHILKLLKLYKKSPFLSWIELSWLWLFNFLCFCLKFSGRILSHLAVRSHFQVRLLAI